MKQRCLKGPGRDPRKEKDGWSEPRGGSTGSWTTRKSVCLESLSRVGSIPEFGGCSQLPIEKKKNLRAKHYTFVQ